MAASSRWRSRGRCRWKAAGERTRGLKAFGVAGPGSLDQSGPAAGGGVLIVAGFGRVGLGPDRHGLGLGLAGFHRPDRAPPSGSLGISAATRWMSAGVTWK